MDREKRNREAYLAQVRLEGRLERLRLAVTIKLARLATIAKNEKVRQELVSWAEHSAVEEWGIGTVIDWKKRKVFSGLREEGF